MAKNKKIPSKSGLNKIASVGLEAINSKLEDLNRKPIAMKTDISRRNFLQQAKTTSLTAASVSILGQGSLLGSPASQKIKIGQIGTAHGHASGKMRSYRNSDQFEVVGVVENDPKRKARAQKSSTYKDLPFMSREKLLNIPGLQAVAIETEIKDFLDEAEPCIQAGKHIHLEKPGGTSLPRFKKILDEAARKKLTVQLGYMYRYNPAVVFMREAIAKGWLGDIFEIHTVMSKVCSRSLRNEMAEYPGGNMFELGCHIIDLMIGVLKAPTKVTAFKQHASKIEDDLVDNMLAVLEYPKAIASVKSSAMEVEGFGRRHFVVCGTGGTLHIQPLDAPNVELTLNKNQGKFKRGKQTIKLGSYPRYVGDAADLAKIIRGEKESDFPVEHEYQVLKTVLEACGL